MEKFTVKSKDRETKWRIKWRLEFVYRLLKCEKHKIELFTNKVC